VSTDYILSLSQLLHSTPLLVRQAPKGLGTVFGADLFAEHKHQAIFVTNDADVQVTTITFEPKKVSSKPLKEFNWLSSLVVVV
jgi:hypothetical protein